MNNLELAGEREIGRDTKTLKETRKIRVCSRPLYIHILLDLETGSRGNWILNRKFIIGFLPYSLTKIEC